MRAIAAATAKSVSTSLEDALGFDEDSSSPIGSRRRSSLFLTPPRIRLRSDRPARALRRAVTTAALEIPVPAARLPRPNARRATTVFEAPSVKRTSSKRGTITARAMVDARSMSAITTGINCGPV